IGDTEGLRGTDAHLEHFLDLGELFLLKEAKRPSNRLFLQEQLAEVEEMLKVRIGSPKPMKAKNNIDSFRQIKKFKKNWRYRRASRNRCAP
ncbi:MAG: hypothetical protein AAFP15_20200, partial [Bacteroidota bacterium]